MVYVVLIANLCGSWSIYLNMQVHSEKIRVSSSVSCPEPSPHPYFCSYPQQFGALFISPHGPCACACEGTARTAQFAPEGLKVGDRLYIEPSLTLPASQVFANNRPKCSPLPACLPPSLPPNIPTYLHSDRPT